MGFLKVLFFLILGYYLLLLLGRLLRPWIRSWAARKTEQFFNDLQNRGTSAPEEPVGEVSIDRKPRPGKRASRQVGEYIEYEEID